MVYGWCMTRTRTNIALDDHDVKIIMDRYKLPTKTAAVALALRRLAGDSMTTEEALAMHGANAIDVDLMPPDARPVYE